MEDIAIWAIGFVASIFISMSMIPQAYKMWKMRFEKLQEFSIFWFIFNILGSMLFLWYGILINQIGLIILNGLGLITQTLMLLIYKGVWNR